VEALFLHGDDDLFKRFACAHVPTDFAEKTHRAQKRWLDTYRRNQFEWRYQVDCDFKKHLEEVENLEQYGKWPWAKQKSYYYSWKENNLGDPKLWRAKKWGQKSKQAASSWGWKGHQAHEWGKESSGEAAQLAGGSKPEMAVDPFSLSPAGGNEQSQENQPASDSGAKGEGRRVRGLSPSSGDL
jgi:hypothetical protein